jgi:RHS repeat-associated protein
VRPLPAGEITSITNGTYLLTGSPATTNPQNLVSTLVNGPNGPISYVLGNGLSEYCDYDSLGRRNGGWVCGGTPSLACSSQLYGFYDVWQGAQLKASSDDVTGLNVTYGYDGFNRLTSTAFSNSGTFAGSSFTYTYDRYGNRTAQTVTAGSGPQPQFSVNPANNQLSGYTYDLAGNMINDGTHSYTYDAEGNIVAVDNGSTAQYLYDARNRRVQVQTAAATTDYRYDFAGRRISSWLNPTAANPLGTGVEGRLYWGGQQIAFRAGDGTTYFEHQDWTGTERLRTNYLGQAAQRYSSLPWGDDSSAAIGGDGDNQDNAIFAGLDLDTESGTGHAQFRNYSQTQGRWLAPDPYDGSYDITNPQSFSRYAYALNNPLSFIDRLGLDPCPGAGGGGGGADPGDGGDGDDPNDPEIARSRVRPDDTGCDCGPNCVGVVADPPTPLPDPCDTYDCFAGPPSSGPGGGGGTGTAPSKPKSLCDYIYDVGTVGVGGDAGLGGAVSGQLFLAANGNSGELSLVESYGWTAGVTSFGAYFTTGVAYNAPSNSALNSSGHDQFGGPYSNTSYNAGVQRVGVSAGGSSAQLTIGPSLLPATLSATASEQSVIATVPNLGFLLNLPRAVCKALGH